MIVSQLRPLMASPTVSSKKQRYRAAAPSGVRAGDSRVLTYPGVGALTKRARALFKGLRAFSAMDPLRAPLSPLSDAADQAIEHEQIGRHIFSNPDPSRLLPGACGFVADVDEAGQDYCAGKKNPARRPEKAQQGVHPGQIPGMDRGAEQKEGPRQPERIFQKAKVSPPLPLQRGRKRPAKRRG